MEIRYKRQGSKFLPVQEEANDYDIVVSITNANDQNKNQLHVTHKIEIRSNSQKKYESAMDIGKWTFRNDSIFCFDSKAEQCRIDLQAKCKDEDSYYDFYMLSPYIQGDPSIVEVFMDMISQISASENIHDFDKKSNNTSVSRMGETYDKSR